MKKLLLSLFILWFLISVGYCSAPSRPNLYVSGQVIDPVAVTANETTLYSYLQAGVDTYLAGSISNTAISGTAGITYGKLSLAGGILGTDINTSVTTNVYTFGSVTVPNTLTVSGQTLIQGPVNAGGFGGIGNVLESQGGSSPIWANSVSSISDYGTSASASTARQGTALKIAYGTIAGVTNGGLAITNLPFSSSSSYHCVASQNTASGTAVQVSSYDSASQMTLSASASTQTVGWICMGT